MFKSCFVKAGKYLQKMKNKEDLPRIWLLNKHSIIYQVRNIQEEFNSSGFTGFCEIPLSDM